MAAFLFWERLRDRLKPPILALALVVLADLVSCFYAVSGKFALNELLKIVSAFCVALVLLAFTGTDRPERKVSIVLEVFGAVAGLVSIDYMSTRWISTPVLTALGWFTRDFARWHRCSVACQGGRGERRCRSLLLRSIGR